MKIKVRLRTYPQHTLPLLPLLRSRPGGVHKTSVVRSPKSDKCILDCRMPIVDSMRLAYPGKADVPVRIPVGRVLELTTFAQCGGERPRAQRSDRGLAMSNQPQQTIDTEMQ